MKILLIEPYYTDSHKQWTKGFLHHGDWEVQILSLPGRHWKWRMHAAAIYLAEQWRKLAWKPDLVIASEMMDLAQFRSLSRDLMADIPLWLYFHENQLTYPFSDKDTDHKYQRDNHYAFINFTSMLVADHVIFNSQYHRDVLFDELPDWLMRFPRPHLPVDVELMRTKCSVIPPALFLSEIVHSGRKGVAKVPVIVWNHRWEYDKNPELFFDTLFDLSRDGLSFQLIVMGGAYAQVPEIFAQARKKLQAHILHWGYVNNQQDYYRWLAQGDIVVSTSRQDFYGISVLEAIYAGCWPLLPNRLAFPEHIPEDFQSMCLFNQDEELGSYIKRCCQKLDRLQRQHPKLKERIRAYDVNQVNLQYQALFDHLSSFSG